MVEQLTIQTISQVATAIGVIFAASYYIITVRNTAKIRKTQLILQIMSTLNKKDFVDPWTDVMYQQEFSSYKEWRGKYDPFSNPEAANNLYAAINSFTGLAWLIKEKLLEPDTLFNWAAPGAIKARFNKLRPLLETMRERYNDPTMWSGLDLLFDEASKKGPEAKIPEDSLSRTLYEKAGSQE
jgi:hypothetical protein